MKKIKRRSFLKKSAAASAAFMVLPRLGFSKATDPFDPKGLPLRVLGKTGIKVPLLGFGLGSRWMSVQDDDQALEVLEYALDNGLYYWDTAATYKNDRITSEERIGKLLPSCRERVFLVSKIRERDADKAKESVERSLKRLNTDYIDLMHVHNLQSVEDAESMGEKGKLVEVLHQYRDEGIIKHIGFTGHTSAKGMKRAAKLYDFEVMMIALNHHVGDGTQDFEELAVPFAYKKGLGVVAMKVVRPRETVENIAPSKLIQYALSIEEFSIANIGMESKELVRENIDLIKNFEPLQKSEMEDIRAALQPFYNSRELAWMQHGYEDGVVRV